MKEINEALRMIINAKRKAIKEFSEAKKEYNTDLMIKLNGKINGLNIAIDILCDRY